MRIAIDARFVQGPNTGVTNYLVSLLREISNIDKHNTYDIFISDSNYRDRVPIADNFHIKINTKNALFWKNVWLPSEIRKARVDVVHFPAYTGSFVNIGKNIVTIHDLIHKINPRWFSPRERFLIDFPVWLAINKATKIIAVSENTKRDIMKFYRLPQDKIAVTLEAADSSFKPINEISKLESIKRKYSIDSEFILYVGVLFKRRNIARLLEAFSLLKRNRNIKHKLVLAGPGRKYFNLDYHINKYGLNEYVIYLGYVEQDDMPLLFNAASFFVYPSLYEGFGLPVLEAMSCGKAVVTSCVSSLPEVLGDAGLLVNPYNTEELYDAMYKLCQNNQLREKLGNMAVARSAIFSWNRMAKQTIELYSEIAN